MRDRLRRASPADAASVAALVDRAYGHYIERIGRRPRPMEADHARAIAEHEVWVVERDGAIVATLELIPEADHLFIENVAVDPGAQGRGVGRRLLHLAETEARRRGLWEMRLATNSRFTENRAIYRGLGYVETGELPTETTPIVTFAKALVPAPATVIDHVVVGAASLEAGIAWLRDRGLEARPGGRHPGWGTHNALAPLAGERYVEVLAPDPAVDAVAGLRAELAALPQPTLWTWAVRSTDLDATVAAARAAGLELEDPVAMSRERPDGSVLRWRLAFPVGASRLVPFVIGWGAGTVHPSAGGSQALEELVLGAPDPRAVRDGLRALALDGREPVIVDAAERESMELTLEGEGRR